MKDIKKIGQKRIDKFFGNIINSYLIIKNKFKNKSINKKPKTIAIYKLDAIGDSVVCLPMIKYLKEKTGAKIILVCSNSNKDVFEGQKFIDEVFIINSSNFSFIKLYRSLRELKDKSIDISIDTGQTANISAILSSLTGNYSIGFKNNSLRDKAYDFSIKVDYKKHMFYNYMNLISPIGIKHSKNSALVKLVFSEEDIKKVQKKIEVNKKIICIHPFASINVKQWPAKRFMEIIKYLHERGETIGIIGGTPNEVIKGKEFINAVKNKYGIDVKNLCGLSIKELSALMTKVRLFIGNDGGPMHVSAAMGVPTIGLFGYENPRRYAPLNKKSISVYKTKSHSECKKEFLIEWPKCRNPEHILSISIEDVKKAVNKIKL